MEYQISTESCSLFFPGGSPRGTEAGSTQGETCRIRAQKQTFNTQGQEDLNCHQKGWGCRQLLTPSEAARPVPACFRGQPAQPPLAQGSPEQLPHSPFPTPSGKAEHREGSGRCTCSPSSTGTLRPGTCSASVLLLLPADLMPDQISPSKC